MTSAKTRPSDALLKRLRERSLAKYPEAHLKSPWPGHLDLAVRDKTFAYLSVEGEPLGISCKLPSSSAIALMLPGATPTGYGLGKSGWVSLACPEGELPDEAMLEAWIDESYRAQAPKKLIALLDGAPAKASPAKPAKASPAEPAKASPAEPAKASPAKPAKASPAKPSSSKPSSPKPASTVKKRSSR